MLHWAAMQRSARLTLNYEEEMRWMRRTRMSVGEDGLYSVSGLACSRWLQRGGGRGGKRSGGGGGGGGESGDTPLN